MQNSARSNSHHPHSLEEHYEKIAEMAKDGKRGMAGQAPTRFSAVTQSIEVKPNSVKPDQL